MKVVVFGSSRPAPGDPDYLNGYNLGQLLAQTGMSVITGGYCGTMEAVSRGANEAHGHVIGVTCAEIEAWRPLGANPWVLEEVKSPTLSARIDSLIDLSDAAIALPGGPGTLAEISIFWNKLIIHAMPEKPLIMIGSAWKQMFAAYREHASLNVKHSDWNYLHFADSPEEAVNQLLKLTGQA